MNGEHAAVGAAVRKEVDQDPEGLLGRAPIRCAVLKGNDRNLSRPFNKAPIIAACKILVQRGRWTSMSIPYVCTISSLNRFGE